MDLSKLKERQAGVAKLVAGVGQKSLRKIDAGEQPIIERRGEFRVADSDAVIGAQEVVMNKASLFPAERREAVLALQDFNDRAKLVADLMGVPVQETDFFQEHKAKLQKKGILAKAMDTATADEGNEWVPTTYSSRLFELIETEARVSPIFEHIDMPRSPFAFPIVDSRPTIYLGSEATADQSGNASTITDTNPGTGAFTLTAKKLNARTAFSEELEEDSIAAIMPLLRKNLAYHMARSIDDAILNGDTSGTHQDSDVTAGSDRRKAFRGLRRHAIANSLTTDLSTFSAANLRAMIAQMGEYGIDNVENLVFIVGPKVLNKQIRNLGNELRTVDEYGPGVAFQKGEVGRFDGIRIQSSAVVREDVNASGYRDLTTTNKGVLHLVHKGFFYVGDRRAVRVRLVNSEMHDQKHIIIDWRGAFDTPFQTGDPNANHCVLGINITT